MIGPNFPRMQPKNVPTGQIQFCSICRIRIFRYFIECITNNIQYRPASKKHHLGLRVNTLSRATAWGPCHKEFKHTNELYAANEPNFLGPISYVTQQVEPHFLMACMYIHSYERAGTVLYTLTRTSTVVYCRCILFYAGVRGRVETYFQGHPAPRGAGVAEWSLGCFFTRGALTHTTL